MVEGTMKTHKLPQTDSIQELARFWDTHEINEFEGQLEEATEPIFDQREMIPLHLASTEANAVRKLAEAKGLADAELIRSWVLEQINDA